MIEDALIGYFAVSLVVNAWIAAEECMKASRPNAKLNRLDVTLGFFVCALALPLILLFFLFRDGYRSFKL